MKKVLENVGIVLCFAIIIGFMFTGSMAFASEPKYDTTNKSYYFKRDEKSLNYHNIDLVMSDNLLKKVESSRSSVEYKLIIKDGNVYSDNLNDGSRTIVYSKGDAKALAQVDFYYYNSAYVLIVTEDGSLYANLYTNNDYRVKFKKIKTNNRVTKLTTTETEKRFYDYPIVELYGVDQDGNWELIKL